MKNFSMVESIAVKQSGFKLKYDPVEKVAVIVVDNFPMLGKLTALRFLEWVQSNPDGVISLPTGKTPEYFIKEVNRFITNWNKKEVKVELEKSGLDPSKKPQFNNVRFVQIDEFYPIETKQTNSFYYYVNKYYINNLGLQPQNVLLINPAKIGLPKNKSIDDVWPDKFVDLTFRYKQAKNSQQELQKLVIENIDQWCSEYEEKIRKLGGIGFFIGGIGPDGHIGFNIQGSDHNSTTRLTPINYETQAAASTDLGGIEVARKRLVITIGLSTITYNSDCVALIIAAGEAKAQIIASAIQQPEHIHYPGTVLQKLDNARFYITRGAAKLLRQRIIISLSKMKKLDNRTIEKLIIDLSLKTKTKIDELSIEDFQDNEMTKVILEKTNEPVDSLKMRVKDSLIEKIENGIKINKNKVFFHTEPHHDDILLGYLPYIVRNIREHSNQHHFLTLTSGFTAVTNQYMLDNLILLSRYLSAGKFKRQFSQRYFNPNNINGRNRDVWQFLDGVASKNEEERNYGELRRLIRNIVDLYKVKSFEELKNRVSLLINYFSEIYPGKKDVAKIQTLKGMCREWEADCVWGYLGWHSKYVHHLRLGFYKGNIFTEEPTFMRDVKPILRLLKSVKPDVIGVAFDPEASGPDTHYKVLQAITEALKQFEKETGHSSIEILGYRNVWYRFHPSEVDLLVPVSLNMFALQDTAFKNAFVSQKNASFPSYEYDGPFSELAQSIQVEQYKMLKICLGREYFYQHPSAMIRATRGMVFLKSMNLDQFYNYSREIKKRTENR